MEIHIEKVGLIRLNPNPKNKQLTLNLDWSVDYENTDQKWSGGRSGQSGADPSESAFGGWKNCGCDRRGAGGRPGDRRGWKGSCAWIY